MKVAMGLFVLLLSASVDAAWNAWSSEDPMTGTVRKGVVSSWTGPLRAMRFPYSDVKAVVGLSCEGRGAYLRFTAAPNITGDTNHSGYSESRLRVRFDDAAPKRIPFTQEWGSDQLSTSYSTVRSGVIGKRSMMLEIPWHGEGAVIFRFDLTGSSDAYKAACSERLARDAKQAARAEERKRERERKDAERKAKTGSFLADKEKTRRHVEAAGWSCPAIEKVEVAGADWYIDVWCTEGMNYLIRTGDWHVLESRRSGRRTKGWVRAAELKRERDREREHTEFKARAATLLADKETMGAMVRGAGGLCWIVTKAEAMTDRNGRPAVRAECQTRKGAKYTYRVYVNGEVKVGSGAP